MVNFLFYTSSFINVDDGLKNDVLFFCEDSCWDSNLIWILFERFISSWFDDFCPIGRMVFLGIDILWSINAWPPLGLVYWKEKEIEIR